MKKGNISTIISKIIIHDEISDHEQQMIDKWINESERNKEHYKDIIDNYQQHIGELYQRREQITKNDNVLIRKITRDNQKKKLHRRLILISSSSIAAVLVILFVALSVGTVNTQTNVLMTNNATKPTSVHIIEDNGNKIELESDKPLMLNNNDVSTQLIESAAIKTEKEEINTLVIPSQKRYSITLSDGTVVHLNANTRMRYPKKFIGEQRVVEVVGEAYFDVVRDTLRPFIVKTKFLTTKVLGTKFFVSSYPDDKTNNVSLISGSVKVNSNTTKHSMMLAEGHGVTFDEKDNSLTDSKVDKSFIESFLGDKFIFPNRSLEFIVNELKKWYGVEVIYENEDIKNIIFFIKTNKHESITKIMDLMECTKSIKYTFKNNILTIDRQ